MQKFENRPDAKMGDQKTEGKLDNFDFLSEVSAKVDLFSPHRTTIIAKTKEQMKIFCELAEAITERFAQEMENLQDVFASYLHSNLRTFLNNSDVLHEAKLCYQNLEENDTNDIQNGNLGVMEDRHMTVDQLKVHQITASNPQLFSRSATASDIRISQFYKLLQKKSLDFLVSNAERAFKNLTQFSFSDLEIVSKSGQTVCAKLADKMRNKMLDEELPDVRVSLKAKLDSIPRNPSKLKNEELLSKYLMDIMKGNRGEFGQGVPFKAGESYLKPTEIKNVQIDENQKTEFNVQKELLKVLFPEGFNLKDIELEGMDLTPDNKDDIEPISEQSSDKENYVSGNLHIKDKTGFYFSVQNSESDFVPIRSKIEKVTPALVQPKKPKESITNMIKMKKMTQNDSKMSNYSMDKTPKPRQGQGKYKNNAIHRILKKRKEEIRNSMTPMLPNVDESFLKSKTPVAKKESKIYKSKLSHQINKKTIVRQHSNLKSPKPRVVRRSQPYMEDAHSLPNNYIMQQFTTEQPRASEQPPQVMVRSKSIPRHENLSQMSKEMRINRPSELVDMRVKTTIRSIKDSPKNSETRSNLRYQPPRILNRFRQQTTDFMKAMDGKQQMVLKRFRATKEKERLTSLRRGPENQVILRESTNVKHVQNYGIMEQPQGRVSRIVRSKSPYQRKMSNERKVSPIIISTYKSDQSPTNTRENSFDSKKKLKTKETERIYVSSSKPQGPITYSRQNQNETRKIYRSVSPLIRKKQIEMRNSSVIPMPRQQETMRKQYIYESEIIQKNEKEIIEKNRRDNMKDIKVSRVVRRVPIQRKTDEVIKPVRRVVVDDPHKGRSIKRQVEVGRSLTPQKTEPKRKVVQVNGKVEPVNGKWTQPKEQHPPSFRERKRRDTENYNFVEVKSKITKEERNQYFEMQRNPLVHVRLSERPKRVLKLWLYDTSGSSIFAHPQKDSFQKKQDTSNDDAPGVATALYVFYGKDMSYFFVDEVPQEDLPNPTDDFSVLESRTPKSFNPMESQLTSKSRNDGMSSFSQSRSYLYKQNEPTVFSDKAMQLKHKGLTISQICVGQVSFGFAKRMRKNSSKTGIKPVVGVETRRKDKFVKVLLLLEKSKGVSKDRSLKLNTYTEVVHVVELDRELGYNFLKKCKINIHHGIFQIFESKQTDIMIIVTRKGDVYQYDLHIEILKPIAVNPNNNDVTKQFEKIKSAEMFDNGNRIVISMGNGDLLVYHLQYVESGIQMMIGPYEGNNKEDSFNRTNQTFGQGFGDMLATLDNKSIHSFTVAQQLPISIISSGEDPSTGHKNTISTNIYNNKGGDQSIISFKETQEIHSILNDINISPKYIQENIKRVGSLLMMHHPLGHKIFFKKQEINVSVKLINNSKVDTFFKKIIPYKRHKTSDLLFLLGQNGVILQIDFTNINLPETVVFEGDSKMIVLLCKKHEKLLVYDLQKEKLTYKCQINLLKGMSRGIKNNLLVGFDDGQMEMMMLSHHKIFKMILKMEQA